MLKSKSKYITHLIIALLTWCTSELMAQSGISAVYAPSKVIKHRGNLLFQVPEKTQEFRLAYTYQTDGSREWERYWHLPRFSLNALWVSFGSDELGHAFAILPELHFTLAKVNRFKLNMQFGTGIAYLTTPFDAITNPTNNAIGSHLNNTSSLKFGVEYKWSDKWTTSLSTGLVHFSNGLSSSPNSGINIYGLSFNTIYQWRCGDAKYKDIASIRNSDEQKPDGQTHGEVEGKTDGQEYRKWIADVQFHYGFTEHSTPGGPKFGVQAYSLGAGYRYNKFMTVFIGGEYEYNNGTYIFFKRNFETEEVASRRAKKTIVYISNEFRYGRAFNRFRLGFYLGWPAKNTKNNYLKLTTGIYLPRIKDYGQPYIGIVLKSHIAVADYLAAMVGVRF